MIKPLADFEAFGSRRRDAWARNAGYWLSQPLRHVTDTGKFIIDRVEELVYSRNAHPATIVDMGCGSCWLLEALHSRKLAINYIGIDNNPEFIKYGRSRFAVSHRAEFILADVDASTSQITAHADIVVNAFNFFELANLPQAMRNVSTWLKPRGALFMSTIDKTYLILALSKDWADFHENLKRYQEQQGTKYDFQKIDTGSELSDTLEYPSVLYTTQNFIETAQAAGLVFRAYSEQAFTGRPIPKIYCHLEFHKTSASEVDERHGRA